MNKLAALVFLALFASLATATAILEEVELEPVNDFAETIDGDEGEGSIGVTSYNATIFLQSGGKPDSRCYRCSYPCSNYQCCPGRYPQCCFFQDRGCRCCSS